MKARWFMVAMVAGWAMGCEQEDPCADYVDYMCECHDGEDDFDCDELRTTYANADSDVQDECAIALDDQQDIDDDDGLECVV